MSTSTARIIFDLLARGHSVSIVVPIFRDGEEEDFLIPVCLEDIRPILLLMPLAAAKSRSGIDYEFQLTVERRLAFLVVRLISRMESRDWSSSALSAVTDFLAAAVREVCVEYRERCFWQSIFPYLHRRIYAITETRLLRSTAMAGWRYY